MKTELNLTDYFWGKLITVKNLTEIFRGKTYKGKNLPDLKWPVLSRPIGVVGARLVRLRG